MSQVDRYAVIGHPIEHSLSPLLHTAFAQQTGQAMRYDLLPAPPTGFATVAAAFFRDGGCGLNVTLPFKGEAAAFVDLLVGSAQTAAAVNTIQVVGTGPKPQTRGFNTDGVGLVRDITENLGWSLAGQRVLLLGAGGAARGALVALLAQRCASITVANRTLAKAERLVEQVLMADEDGADSRPEIASCALHALREPVDLVINATSASMSGKGDLIAPSVVTQANCYDMLYAQNQTQFCEWAKASGAAGISDGLGMLVEQAAEAFFVWRQVRPDVTTLLAQRAQLFV